MLFIAIAMVLVLVVAVLVLTFAAYPHRGQDVPNASWLSDAMARAADRAPVLKDDRDSTPIDLMRR